VTSPNTAANVLTSPNVDERVDIHVLFTTAASSAGARFTVRNDAGVSLTLDSTAFSSMQQPTYDRTFWGTPSICSRPYDVAVIGFSSTVNYDITATRFRQPNFNNGGAAMGMATPLTVADGGVACELLCGGMGPCTPNEPQWFSVTIPAQGAIDLYVRAVTGTQASSGNLAVEVYDNSGAFTCRPVNAFVGSLPTDSTARVVNNLTTPQNVYLAVRNFSAPAYADITYSIAAGIEQ
jgi:hypothetical protein